MKGQSFLSKGQETLRKHIRKIAEEAILPRAAEIEEKNAIPPDLKALLQKNGLLGYAFPREHGGYDGDMVGFCVVAEELSRASMDISLWCAFSYLGALPVMLAGSQEQRSLCLPEVASGTKMCAFCLTEAQSGADPNSISTGASFRDETWILNGTKRFVPFGDSAEWLAVFARTEGEAGMVGVSCFLVSKGMPGVRIGQREKKMGLKAIPSVELVLNDCAVPRGNLLGVMGQGADLATRCLARVRPLIAASGVGVSQAALDAAVAYAKERVQFGQPIAQFEGIQSMLAEMATQIEAARLLAYHAAALVDEDDPSAPKVGSMAKCFATDVAMKVTTDALQVHGGYGYMKDLPMERYMREAKYAQIIEGSNRHQRLLIAQEMLRGL